MTTIRSELAFAPKDAPLREDVRTLGRLVGDMLSEQGGPALLGAVESARKAAIARREAPEANSAALCQLLHELPRESWSDFIRAFSTWFQVVNLAEQVHRIRRRRHYLREGASPQPGGLEATLGHLAANGVGAEQVTGMLGALLFEPVFTAHPTEPTRRTILRKLQHVGRQLVERFDPSMTPQESARTLGLIRSEITSAWQTEEHPSQRMTVADEREHVLFFLSEVIYRVIPVFYETLRDALASVYDETTSAARLPTVIRFASWVGGDMDGNPNVTATSIRESLARHRTVIVARYHRDCLDLSEHLSQTRSRVGHLPAVDRRIERYSGRFPSALGDVHARHRDMPYRLCLRLIAARLKATYEHADYGYVRASEFTADIEAIADSLRDDKGLHAGYFAVRRLLRRALTFGFHLATLDVRQDSLVHRRAVGDLIRDTAWLDHDPAQRLSALHARLEDTAPANDPESEEAQRTLAVFEAIADCRQEYGGHAVGPYIISMAQRSEDILSVLFLAHTAGLRDADGAIPLDIAPLFETVEDLQRAARVMRELFADPVYRVHLATRSKVQIVMVGYSDSNKDGGLAAARWALQRAQAELGEVAAQAGIRLTIFHGRGGTISRGGSKTHTAVLAAPRGTLNGHLRATEQGEMINAKYGLRGIAIRHLERAFSSVLLETALPHAIDPREEHWHGVFETIASRSREAYRSLVYERPGFVDYFRQATPIDVIEKMQIGSRPASRRAGRGIEDLRAIPWVFAWTQSRCILPGWYGVGAGLAAAREQHGAEVLREMALEWPFMAALVEDLEMILAKCDMDIAEHYNALAESRLRPLFDTIRDEFHRTEETVLDLTGTTSLLDGDHTLKRAIRLRNPYVDPMNLLQIEMLARWREDGRPDDDTLGALLASVNGIAHGLQNTG